ncbi:energy-coupling factor transporter transmembrane component T family protein [Acholeplasma hippikon]|uniref:Energy-coupling factor transporter transmembrane protein EcfT n=1 Tax=Acholeplasma hippikon TaxID=264636 RepID=A0A449BKH2_9MOLU|nr:energy-coupling factor transporter transmembrane component T [Acholeplasma hippikon]VEU82944.1 Energy-coupling factor transporter transmembrane protein EcfT [Acholeplasma hippikon]
MNIRIGQYILGDSFLHKMDPRIKLLSMLMLIVSIFSIGVSSNIVNISLILFMFVFTVFLVFLSGIPFGKVIQGLKAVVFLLTFTFFIQLFTIRPADQTPLMDVKMTLSVISIPVLVVLFILYQWMKQRVKWKTTLFFIFVFLIFFIQYLVANYLNYGAGFIYDFKVYQAGLVNAGFIFLRITSVMIVASLLTFTTSTIELNDALESLLTPFRLIGLKTYIISMMISLTLRTIPTLLEETQKIMKAQTSRGADINESSIKDKIGQIIALLIPVFVINMSRADDLSNAMEARGYIIGEKRTKIDVYEIKGTDIFSVVLTSIFLVGIIAWNIYAL